MVTLTIIRDSGYADLVRSYAVMLDDQKIGELKNAETKKFSICPGVHTLCMKIDWCSSKTLTITAIEGEALAFNVSSNFRGLQIFLSLWYVLFDRSSYLRIEQEI